MKQLAVYAFATLFLVVLIFAPPALADSTANYAITGTYGAGTPTTALTGAGQSFTMDFSIPTQPASLIGSNYMSGDDFYVYPVSISYSFGGATTSLVDSLVAFYAIGSSSQPGGLFVDYCTDAACSSLEYQWTLTGPQQYTGSEDNPTLVPTSFSSNGQDFTVFDNSSGAEFNSSINATVNGKPVSTPEPSSLLLLGAGLAGLALAKFRA